MAGEWYDRKHGETDWARDQRLTRESTLRQEALMSELVESQRQEQYERQLQAQAENAARLRREHEEWLLGSDGEAFAAWKSKSTDIMNVCAGRDEQFAGAFAADVADVITDADRSAYQKRAYSPKPKRQSVADAFLVAGIVVVVLSAAFGGFCWLISRLGARDGAVTIPVIVAAAVGIIFIVLGSTVGDRAWDRANTATHDKGVADRKARFGFDPLKDTKRVPTWHTSGALPITAWQQFAARVSAGHHPSQFMFPKLVDPEVRAAEPTDGERVAALLDAWKSRSLLS